MNIILVALISGILGCAHVLALVIEDIIRGDKTNTLHMILLIYTWMAGVPVLVILKNIFCLYWTMAFTQEKGESISKEV